MTKAHISLSNTTKMPGLSYSIPACECNVGGKLHEIDGSVCSKCYARKGRYVFPNVQNALYNRFEAVTRACINPKFRKKFIADFVWDIQKEKWFRWHDSGDLQSLEHLQLIVDICKRTPKCRHWLPTKEKALVKMFLRKNSIPDNLTIRISAAMIGDTINPKNLPTGVTSSSVGAGVNKKCYARERGNCGKCRACWHRSVINVDYTFH